ncbi:hypothetical protein AMATHDRAFT_72337 [Amanita thiersii Skay4041]|uniref:DH domain-containing protein n=1 Tax=Amanita thiersii Skay4041 TaxID=703135 RepID=A0A2A9P0G6_9AGAR|nr:hypothetical protein AMATHDRAFT_72337 [Amanita thiersii Skay4041]
MTEFSSATTHDLLPPLPDTPSSLPQIPTSKPPSSKSPPSHLSNIPTNIPHDPATPTTPRTPTTPTSPTSPDSKPRRLNPLNDLIETEKFYVEQLTGVIRKVAAAWSRSNLPPPELDTMFRSIETIYKANRNLYSKLKEVGSNPSNPKALGDLLMRWIDELDGPYSSYCSKYCCGFDDWEPVKSNNKLADILRTFSASTPPPSVSSSSADDPLWTLDGLFILPKGRLKYYRKLFGRLLKSTPPGRSDHRLLVGALDKLDTLMAMVESRSSITVGHMSHSLSESIDEVVVDFRPPSNLARIPLSELEHRLSTNRTLDIFTMSPKVVRLQMSPPSLTFTRELRYSVDVTVRFTPRATNVEVVHSRGHIILLSDLFLICERMTPEEKGQQGADGPDRWLCYPPLSGKVLRLVEVEGQPHALQVAIMKKEFITFEADSVQIRNTLKEKLKDCIEFSSSLPPPSKQPPPPVPPLNVPLDKNGNHGTYVNNVQRLDPSPSSQREIPQGGEDCDITNSMSKLVLAPEAQLQQGAQRVPSVQNLVHGSMYPRSSSAAPIENHTRFNPNQGLPPRPHPGQFQQTPFPPGPPSHQDLGLPASARSHHPLFSPQRQPLPLGAMAPGMYPAGGLPLRPPSDPSVPHGLMRKSPSSRSLASQYSQQDHYVPPPPVPPFMGNAHGSHFVSRTSSMSNLQSAYNRPPLLPSAQMTSRDSSVTEPSFDDPSPPGSPLAETNRNLGPVTSTVSTRMKCKVFLQQQHAQWKSLGSAKLTLYVQRPTNIKQLVVESSKRAVLISTIILTDGVERVGKTGIAIELSDNGARTGIVYMLQLQNEALAVELFNGLLAGSDRSK